MSEPQNKEETPEKEEEPLETEEETVEETTTEETTVEEPASESEAEAVEPEAAEETETAPAAEKEEGEGEEEIEVVEERIYTIPLRHVWTVTPRGRRAPRAVRDVRDFVSRHMKAEEVSISNEINSALWSRSINKPPRKITVRAVKDKEGKVVVYPAKTA
jgi:large subunit ribosomal protein L31e